MICGTAMFFHYIWADLALYLILRLKHAHNSTTVCPLAVFWNTTNKFISYIICLPRNKASLLSLRFENMAVIGLVVPVVLSQLNPFCFLGQVLLSKAMIMR